MNANKILALSLLCIANFSHSATPVINPTVAEDAQALLNEDEPTSGKLYGGCSWYCADVKVTVSASSVLKSDKHDYAAKQAHDWNVKNAWVEGQAGNGEGAFLEFTVTASKDGEYGPGFGMNSVTIFNGYWKSESLWKENGRVKQFEVKLDGKVFALLNLVDIKRAQTFNLPKIGMKKGEAKVLRFTIKEVYPGSKYQDTAVSEMVFDGEGVH